MRTLELTTAGALALATLALAQRGGGGGRATPQPPPLPARPAPPAVEAPPRAGASRPPAKDAQTPEDPAEKPVLYFRTCDYDGNGWISFSEARASMNLDRAAYAVYDTDGDGRISQEEYVGRYLTITTRGGAFAPPLDKVMTRKVPDRTPEEIIAQFDSNRDGALDARDVQRALAEYGAAGVDGQKVLDSVDEDLSGLVELAEMRALMDVLVPPAIKAVRRKAGSVEELFDRTEERRLTPDSTPQPARIVGPVSTFRRLDFDRSGGIGVDDLDALQRPLHVPIRAGAVIATLDVDGDGVLSPAEFAAAMR